MFKNLILASFLLNIQLILNAMIGITSPIPEPSKIPVPPRVSSMHLVTSSASAPLHKATMEASIRSSSSSSSSSGSSSGSEIGSSNSSSSSAAKTRSTPISESTLLIALLRQEISMSPSTPDHDEQRRSTSYSSSLSSSSSASATTSASDSSSISSSSFSSSSSASSSSSSTHSDPKINEEMWDSIKLPKPERLRAIVATGKADINQVRDFGVPRGDQRAQYRGCRSLMFTPLASAVSKGHNTERVKILLEAGADPLFVPFRNGNSRGSILHLCIAHCKFYAQDEHPEIRFSIFKLLLPYMQPVIDTQDAERRTPLWLAADQLHNHFFLEPLIDYYPNPLLKDNAGKTPLDRAKEVLAIVERPGDHRGPNYRLKVFTPLTDYTNKYKEIPLIIMNPFNDNPRAARQLPQPVANIITDYLWYRNPKKETATSPAKK